MFTSITPVDITPANDGTFKTVDVSAYVSNASGILLRVHSTNTFAKQSKIRPVSSSYSNYVDQTTGHYYTVVGIDANDQFEISLESGTVTWTIDLLGYFDADAVEFLSDLVEINSGASDSTWTDYDLTSHTGTDTAYAAICICESNSAQFRTIGVRPNGSTDSNAWQLEQQGTLGALIVECDVDEVIETFSSDATYTNTWLVGYVKDNAGLTLNTDATNISTGTTAAWTNLTIDSGVELAFVSVNTSAGRESWGLRPDGDTDYAGYYDDSHGDGAYSIIPVDSSTGLEGKIESTSVDFYLYGTYAPAAGGGVTGTGDLDAQSSAIAGTGVIGRVGTGALDAQSSTVAGTGTIGQVGTGALDAQASAIAGTGTVSGVGAVTGTGALDAQSSAVAGSGILGQVGTGALEAQAAQVAGTGIIGRVGTGALQCGVATINGVGIASGNITGTGDLAAQASAISGTGTTYTPITITGTGALVSGPSTINGQDDTVMWYEIVSVSTVWTEI